MMVGDFFGCLLCWSVLIPLIFLGWRKYQKEMATFEEKFPPISDEEFVKRCSPGIDPDVALRVRKIIYECLNVDYDRIHPSCRIIQDLGAE